MGIEDGKLIFSGQIMLIFCNLGQREQNVQPNNMNYSATPPSSTPPTKRNMFLELREEKKAPPPVKTKGIDQFCTKPHYTGIFDILICAVEQFDDSDTDSDSNDDADVDDNDDGMSPILLKV